MGSPQMLPKTTRLFLFILLVFSTLPLVSADITDLTIDPSTLSLSLTQNQLGSFDINITNTAITDKIITFSSSTLEDNDDDEIIINLPSGNFTIPASSTEVVTITADVDNTMDLDTYAGTITLTDVSTSDTETFNLDIQVTPGVCDFGGIGSDLILDIQEPDSGDDFNPGDTINIEVDVDNVGADDITVQVEAFLYDESNIIESVSSKKDIIENGEDQTFKFTMKIPTLNTEIDDKEDYVLVIKAFDDDAEQDNCNQEMVSVDIKLEKHKLQIEDSTRFLPPVIACGGKTSLIVDTINLGEEDEDVKITVENSALNYKETSDTFELKDFNSDEDNKGSRTFNVDVPSNADDGTYDFIVKALFSDKTESLNVPLEVISCEFSGKPSTPDYSLSELHIQGDRSLNLQPKGTSTVHVLIENNAPYQKAYFVSLGEVSEFAESTSSTITIDGFQSRNVFLPLNVIASAQPGIYSAVIELTEGTTIVASDTLVVNVEGQDSNQEFSGSFINTLSKGQLASLNIALIVVILVIIYLLKRI